MSALLNKFKKLSFFSHHPKQHQSININGNTEEYSSKKEVWDTWFNNVYANGVWYMHEFNEIINQDKLVQTGGEHKCGITYDTYQMGNNSIFFIYITDWRPKNADTENQMAITYYNNMSQETILSSNQITISIPYQTTLGCDEYIDEGTITIEVLPYINSTNKIYYEGVTYNVNYSNLTNLSVQYFDIELL